MVLQVALEGKISRETILEGLGRGFRAGGDMIPWLISQQFQDNGFAKLSGARVVRIACHPDYANVGYYSLIFHKESAHLIPDGLRFSGLAGSWFILQRGVHLT